MPSFSYENGEVLYGGESLAGAKDEMHRAAVERCQEIMAEVPDKQKRLDTVAPIYEKLAILSAARPSIKINRYSDVHGITINCELDDLEPIARVVGALEEYHKGVKDARKRIVEYTRRAHRYPFVYVSYDVKLPQRLANGESPKCRIETRRTVERFLVCEL